jgi:tRNA threonylcarbamoyladenosine biosynthesis protein TsaB
VSEVLLLLDTAMPHALVAVARDGVVLASQTLTTPQRHAEEIASAVDACLAESKLTRRDITRVLVGTGPGSFIGVRIALAFAQGFARARGIPAHGFSTLLAVASSTPLPPGDGLVVLDAKKGEVYVLPVHAGAHGAEARGEPRPMSPDDVVLTYPKPAFLVGNGVDSVPYDEHVPRVRLVGVEPSGVLAHKDSATPALPDYRRAPDVRLPSPVVAVGGPAREP